MVSPTQCNESEQTPGDSEGEGSLACCSPWGRRESNRTWRLNNNLYRLSYQGSLEQQQSWDNQSGGNRQLNITAINEVNEGKEEYQRMNYHNTFLLDKKQVEKCWEAQWKSSNSHKSSCLFHKIPKKIQTQRHQLTRVTVWAGKKKLVVFNYVKRLNPHNSQKRRTS